MSDPPEITYRVGTKPISAVMESVNEDEARRGEATASAVHWLWSGFGSFLESCSEWVFGSGFLDCVCVGVIGESYLDVGFNTIRIYASREHGRAN